MRTVVSHVVFKCAPKLDCFGVPNQTFLSTGTEATFGKQKACAVPLYVRIRKLFLGVF